MILDYLKSSGGLLLPIIGPPDLRPKKIKVPVRNGRANPDGAIIMHGVTIGKSREFAEQHYRDHGYDPEFVETP